MSWTVIIIIGIGTFILRASFVVALRGAPHPRVSQALRYVPAAVLPAIAISAVIGNGSDPLEWRFAAAALAAVIAWRTRSVALVMITGMLALWGLLFVAQSL